MTEKAVEVVDTANAAENHLVSPVSPMHPLPSPQSSQPPKPKLAVAESTIEATVSATEQDVATEEGGCGRTVANSRFCMCLRIPFRKFSNEERVLCRD